MGYRIITHHGKAHMDELLAISLIAVYRNELPEEITRMNSQEAAALAETGDYESDTYFIDCGLLYDPDNRMFDHHQDINLSCSAKLVFDYFFPELEGSKLNEYISLVSKVDTQGQKALLDFETSDESRKYFSFPQNIVLKAFEEDPRLITGIFTEGLKEKISFEEKCLLAAEWLSEDGNVGIKEIAGLKVLVYNKRPPEGLFQATRSADKDIVDNYTADAVYSFDEDDEASRTLFRTNHGYDNLDFCRADVGETIFCHRGGFLLKFFPAYEDEWKDILMQSALCEQLC